MRPSRGSDQGPRRRGSRSTRDEEDQDEDRQCELNHRRVRSVDFNFGSPLTARAMAGRALEARDIYVVQILKTEGLLWLRRVGLDGEPGVTSGAPILLLETGVPVADRGIGSHCGIGSHSGRFGPPGVGGESPDRSSRHLLLDLLVISRPLAQRKTSEVGDGGESY